MKTVLFSILIAISSYLFGSISTGLIIGKMNGVDLRNAGSNNTGASNAMRVMGLKIGLMTYAGDFLKTAIPMTIAALLLPGKTYDIPRFSLLLSGLFVVIGHNWPVYYHFKGGKGVTCSSAVILFINPLIGSISIAVFFLVLSIWKYISVGSMCMLAANLIATVILLPNEPYTIAFAGILLIFSIIRHRTNIQRLINGNENKISKKFIENKKYKPTEHSH